MVSGDVEKRRIRFASIHGMSRQDIPLAAEVWQSDVIGQIWTTPEVIKLTMLLTRYMRDVDEGMLSVQAIERSTNMDAPLVLDTLREMQMFGVVEEFAINDNCLHASLSLSLLQRIRVLELRERLIELGGMSSMSAFLQEDDESHWSPPTSGDEDAGFHEGGHEAYSSMQLAAAD